MASRFSARLGLLAVAVALAPTPASAENATSAGIESLGRKLDDTTLSEMRGKFITPNDIAYFGVQMRTSWQGADGITTSAVLLFRINFENGAGSISGATPQIMIAFDRQCDSCGDSAMDLAGFSGAAAGGYTTIVNGSGGLPISGLASVHGAVQSQQIAGSDNHVGNMMNVAIVPVSTIAENSSGMTPMLSAASYDLSGGDRLQFILGGNQIGIALSDGNGTDSIVQSVNGDLNQAAQHVYLSSSNNFIDNRMNIIIGLDSLAQQSSRISIQNAMSTMKGHGF
jgi:hypothetical protein